MKDLCVEENSRTECLGKSNMHAKLLIISSPECCSIHINPTPPLPLAPGTAVQLLSAPNLGEPESVPVV